MKFAKLVTFLGLSLLSLQCVASRVVCKGGNDIDVITEALNNQLVNEKNVSTPSTVVMKGEYYYYYTICVTVN